MISLNDLHKAASAFGALCALLALALHAPAASAQAGYVHQVSGNVSIQTASEKARPARAGDKFDGNSLLGTGMDGKLVLKFADGQIVALAANSSLRVDQYRYDPGNLRQSTSTLELLRGQVRVVTGLIGTANGEAVRIIAGDSIIGIQKSGGADFTTVVNPEMRDAGYAVVAKGEIAVRTPDGAIVRVANDRYAPWQPGRAPALPIPIAAAPAVVQAAVAGLWATVLPTDTPVAVAAAAQMAAAAARPTATRAAVGAALAAVGPAVAGVGPAPQPVGYVEQVSNGVAVKTGSGSTAAASVGMTFGPGTTINTEAEGRVVLKFEDGQVLLLGPASTLAVRDYQFDPSNVKSSSASVELVSGAMRVVTGAINTENPAGLSVSAGASIIDALNAGPTDFTVVVDTKAREVGVVRVTEGEVSVHTPYGPVDKIQAGKSSIWGPRTTPDAPIPAETALGLIQAAVALQSSGLPDNAPVAVVPAARAAAALAQANQAQAAAKANPQDAQLQAAAQVATELAALATESAAAANQAVAAKVIATSLDTLPPKATGPALAQAPQASAFPTALPVAPIAPAVTPGAGGGCRGSAC